MPSTAPLAVPGARASPCIDRNRLGILLSLLTGCWLATTASAQDLTVIDILGPVSGCQLGSAETVSIRVQNQGAMVPGGSIFRLSFKIGNQPVQEEVIFRGNTVPSMGTFTHHFSTVAANVSAEGVYTMEASVQYEGDSNAANNSLSGWVIRNDFPSLGGNATGNTVALGADSVQLQGYHGQVQEWQTSADGLRWLALENRTPTQAFDQLSGPSAFRAVVQNGACAADLSSTHWVNPDRMFFGGFE